MFTGLPHDCRLETGDCSLASSPDIVGCGAKQMGVRIEQVWQRFDDVEQSICVTINRASRYLPVRHFFAIISRLGDGIFWYLLLLAFAVESSHGARIALQMAVAGLLSLSLYKGLKQKLVRERPFVSHAGIQAGTAALDKYSFPSGHTLHATCFTTVACNHVPELLPVLLPFTCLVAASRVILGLHYPTDVAAGGVLGLGIAMSVLTLAPV